MALRNRQRGQLRLETLENRCVPAGFDFGDLPALFGVTLADDGARHMAVGPTLGATRTTEADGKSSSVADSDDGDDGVTFDTIRPSGSQAFFGNITVSVQGAPSEATLDAWIDFNGDGSFSDHERIADSTSVVNGDNIITFFVPHDARAGSTFARFRLSTAGGLSTVGEAADGEVEDYQVAIEPLTDTTTVHSIPVDGDLIPSPPTRTSRPVEATVIQIPTTSPTSTAPAPAPSSFTTTTAILTPSLALAATSTPGQSLGTTTDTSASFSSETVGFRSSTQLSVSVNATQDSSRGVGSIDGFAPAGGMFGQAWQEITNLDAWLEGRNWIERSTALRYWSDQSGIFRKPDAATDEVEPESAGSAKTGAGENEFRRGTGHNQSDEKQLVNTRPAGQNTDTQNPDKLAPKYGAKQKSGDEAANPDRSQAKRSTAADEKRSELTMEFEESEQRLDHMFALVAVAAGVLATRMGSRRRTRTWDSDPAKSLTWAPLAELR